MARSFGSVKEHVKRSDSNEKGLGVVSVDAVARAHEGNVEVSNRESGGARITVKLSLDAKKSYHSIASAISESN
jgi:K+-sensing histidine kinase KdpD